MSVSAVIVGQPRANESWPTFIKRKRKMLDPFYNLPTERQAEINARAHEKLARLRDMSHEERKSHAEKTMAAVDRLSLEWRLAIHEYGYAKVRKAFNAGKTADQFHREQLLRNLDFQL